MTETELKNLSDQQLLDTARKMKSEAILSALLIGLMIGILIYGVAKNTLGFLALIPLFLAFKVFHKPENNRARERVSKLLAERGLGQNSP